MNYWLFKSEPSSFSIDDLINSKNSESIWDGVRNYQARNFMNIMQVGDIGFFYHSSCPKPGIYGLVKVVRKSEADPTQYDEKSDYYDPKSTLAKPIWYCVKVKFLEKFKSPLLLQDIKSNLNLSDMAILRKGNRLSITPVSEKSAKFIINLVQ